MQLVCQKINIPISFLWHQVSLMHLRLCWKFAHETDLASEQSKTPSSPFVGPNCGSGVPMADSLTPVFVRVYLVILNWFMAILYFLSFYAGNSCANSQQYL